MTPPVGVAMYTVCVLLNCDIGSYVKESISFVMVIPGLFLPRSLF